MSQTPRPPKTSNSLIERLAAQLDAGGRPVLKPNGVATNGSDQPPPTPPLPTPPLPTPPLRTMRVEVSPSLVQPMPPPRVERLPLHSQLLSLALLEENGMVALRRRSRIGEEFRIVRHHVLEQLKQTPETYEPARRPSVILVTSARDGEGKSFAALNLAGLLAEGGDRDVVLVDADTAGASLTTHFNLTEAPGLLDFGQSPRQLALSVPIGTAVDRMTFIPVGGSVDTDTRSQLAAQQPIRRLISQVADQFGEAIIVVDSPACLAKSDPTEISAIAGQVILVVESGRTRRADIEQSLDLLDSCPHLSIVLNRAPTRRRGLFTTKA